MKPTFIALLALCLCLPLAGADKKKPGTVLWQFKTGHSIYGVTSSPAIGAQHDPIGIVGIDEHVVIVAMGGGAPGFVRQHGNCALGDTGLGLACVYETPSDAIAKFSAIIFNGDSLIV
jgi:hypothetical protein